MINYVKICHDLDSHFTLNKTAHSTHNTHNHKKSLNARYYFSEYSFNHFISLDATDVYNFFVVFPSAASPSSLHKVQVSQ